MNGFKYGTIVDGEFFTDRTAELQVIKQKLNSENHLILISPRRFGKSSLVRKCLDEVQRPYVWLDFQYVLSVQDFAQKLLNTLLAQYTIERIKHEIRHFRIVPTISTNALTNDWQVSFAPTADTTAILEDVMQLMQKVSTAERRLIVVFDEFQEVTKISSTFDRQLRALMQHQKGLNYIFLGSQESMMESIFEKKKSPFYHFGQLLRLEKIPYDDFFRFVFDRLPAVRFKDEIVRNILAFTACHPYYTQQLAAEVWDMLYYEQAIDDVVNRAIETLVRMHDMDYERLWSNLNRTDRGVLLDIMNESNPMQNRAIAASTTFSALKRLQQAGLVLKTNKYEFEDPFFCHWLKSQAAK